MRYYNNNAIYDYIEENGKTGYFYLAKNRWMIVYGNGKLEPKVLIYLVAMSKQEYENDLIKYSDHEKMKVVESIANQVGLPFMFVGFDEDASKMTEVKVIDKTTNEIIKISTDELLEMYKNYGLFVDKSMSVKEINKSYSNVYQMWQMNLGGRLVVSDIDLIKIENNQVKYVFELKRSKININSWKPYAADYHNFELISNVFANTEAKFYIVYNHRQEVPFIDDISKLKIFKVNQKPAPLIEFDQFCTLEDFFLKYK